MESSLAPTFLICAALALSSPVARGEAAEGEAVLVAAADADEADADEAKEKEEEKKRKEEEKKNKEEARKAEEARKRAEKEKREAEKAAKQARTKKEEEEETAPAAATSKGSPATAPHKTFTIIPKTAEQPAAAPMKLAPGAVAPNSVKGTPVPGALSPPVSRGAAPKGLSPPVSRSGAPAYTAPAGPITTYGKGDLDKPAVPGFGAFPTGGPASGLPGPGGSAGPLEGALPRPAGPSLPPGTLQLLVNGDFGETHVSPGQPVTTSWDVTPALNTSGIALFVTSNPGETCKSKADGNDLFPPSSYHPGFPKGSAQVDLGGQTVGSDLYFLGCAADPDSEGKIKYRKQDTNVVKARYAGLPDLVVSSLEMVSDEIRFKVKNVGEFEKKPGEVDYVVGLTYASASGRPFTRGFGGTAGITSLSRLGPGEETAEDRVTEQRDMKFDGVTQFQLCINPGKKIPESDRSNNCVTRSSGDVLPDLKIVDGHIELAKPQKDKGFWDYAKDVGRCAGPQVVVSAFFGHCNVEFDPSGSSHAVFVTLRNEGGVPVTRGDVRVDLQYDGRAIEGGGIARFDRPVGPGEQITVSKHLGAAKHWQYEDEACCTAIATADPNGKILESDENNNTFEITQVNR